MKSLLELAHVVNRNKTKSLKTLDRSERDRTIDFYERILSGELKTDKEASNFYFSEEPNHPGYRKLKNRLKSRLLNSLVFIDVNSPKFNDAQKAFYTCQKNLVLIKTLLGRNAILSAIELMKKTLKFSVKFELSEISLEIYRLLRGYHATKTGNRSEFKRCTNEFNKYKEIVDAEHLAREHFDNLAFLSINKSQVTNEYLNYAERAIDELDTIQIQSYRFIFIKGSATTIYYLKKRDYRSLIEVAQKTIIGLETKSHVSPGFIGQFYIRQFIAYIQLSDHQNARKTYLKSLKLFEEGSIGWYNVQELYFLLQMRSGQYHELPDIYKNTTLTTLFTNQSHTIKEVWKTYRAYLEYLIRIDKIQNISQNELGTFRIKKFLNEVPAFSLDKLGHNIPILIIQILFLINDRNYSELNEVIEAVEKYTTRYLRKENNFRSNCLIKMLLQVPKRQFHRSAVERHSKPYFAKLRSVPIEIADQPLEIEIIPYETLWEYVLESLDNRFH